jgi:hypothetical protein
MVNSTMKPSSALTWVATETNAHRYQDAKFARMTIAPSILSNALRALMDIARRLTEAAGRCLVLSAEPANAQFARNPCAVPVLAKSKVAFVSAAAAIASAAYASLIQLIRRVLSSCVSATCTCSESPLSSTSPRCMFIVF